MLIFIIRYLGFLKFVPGLAILFDHGLKLYTIVTQSKILDWIDDIEATVLQWPYTTTATHKYGGLQFNCQGKEIGHIHSNGLLDMLMSRKQKQYLMQNGRIQDHHTFKSSGWISFYIKSTADKEYAVLLLQTGYERRMKK